MRASWTPVHRTRVQTGGQLGTENQPQLGSWPHLPLSLASGSFLDSQHAASRESVLLGALCRVLLRGGPWERHCHRHRHRGAC